MKKVKKKKLREIWIRKKKWMIRFMWEMRKKNVIGKGNMRKKVGNEE